MKYFNFIILWNIYINIAFGQSDDKFRINVIKPSIVEYSVDSGKNWFIHQYFDNGGYYNGSTFFRVEENRFFTCVFSDGYQKTVIGKSMIKGSEILDEHKLYVPKLNAFNYLKKLFVSDEIYYVPGDIARGDSSTLYFPYHNEIIFSFPIIFSWNRNTENIYDFVLYEYDEYDNSKLILEKVTFDTIFKSSEISDFKFDPEKYYGWGLTTSDSLNLFRICSYEDILYADSTRTLIKKIEGIDPEWSYIYKATLEENQFQYSEAYKTFSFGILQFPKSYLIINYFTAFCLRLGINEKALELNYSLP